jgi:hypothetical protein
MKGILDIMGFFEMIGKLTGKLGKIKSNLSKF